MKQEHSSPILKHDTYIYIDASNIRAACLKTLGFKIDFIRLIQYFQKKYPNLKEVRYYEGISDDDTEKRKVFRRLEKAGYTVCPLTRKSYKNPAVYKKVKCRKCGNEWRTLVQRKSVSLKSNIDVFLATEFLCQVQASGKPAHFILVSCDGDYAEMIKAALKQNENALISVLGTPVVKNRSNTFSMRLQELRGKVENFTIRNIENIQAVIEGE